MIALITVSFLWFCVYNGEMRKERTSEGQFLHQKPWHSQVQDCTWHSISWQETAQILQTNAQEGLSAEQVKESRRIFGKNRLPEEKTPSRFLIFLNQLKSPLILILVAAGLITLVLKKYTDSTVIWSAVLLNSLIGFVQEYKATKALSELKKIVKIKTLVQRDGNEKEIFQEEIVPGDIIFLKPGNKIPGDARIIESWNLKVEEAVLTGEWLPSQKIERTLDPKVSLADRENMVYMGTVVQEGQGKAVVTAIGRETELGKIASLIEDTKEKQTPYQIKLTRFSALLGRLISLLAFFIFLEGMLAQKGFVEMFTMAVAIAVGAIPEGLPIAITMILAIGMRRILQQGGLVKNLSSTETLGSVSIIATDKTLTLTEGNMEVEELFTLDSSDRELALTTAALANEAFIENPEAVFEQWIMRGRPTDKALLKAAMEAGISKTALQGQMPQVHQLPFESEKRYTASFHMKDGKIRAYIVGAPETLLTLVKNMAEEAQQRIRKKLNELTEKGLRVMALGFKDHISHSLGPNVLLSDHLHSQIKDIVFVGLIAFKDPLRKGAKEAIEEAKAGGIQTIIVTGDHLLTAKAIAKEIGLDIQPHNIIDGRAMDELNDQELQDRIRNLTVYARVEPAHKLRIISAWQRLDAVVAMTGDGVNDAPALKKADIGIALGSGTDVAKEIADLVLLEDKFSIIPVAVREGRIIIDNIRKVVTYMLSGTLTESILIGASILFGLPLPVTASQILWVNLVEDGLPGIALSFEKGQKETMNRKPEGKYLSLFSPAMKVIILAIGFITDFLLLGLYLWFLKTPYSLDHIRTVMFVALAFNSLLYVFSCKNLRQNIWQYNPFSNLYLDGSVILAMLLLVLVVYAPFLQNIFETESLMIFDWILLLGLGILDVILIEITKWYFIRREKI